MFNMFPYVNLHKINLDWIINTVNEAVNTIQHSVRQIEAALDSVNGLTGRVEALETATEQLQESNSALQDRVSHAETRITSLQSELRQQGSTLDTMSSTVSALSTAVAGKAQLPIIINLSADAFPAQIPAADQAQVRAALTALNTGTGAAQAHIEQQVDQDLPAAFNVRLSYAGNGILTGILSQTIYDGTAQEYLSRITTVSINSIAMTWEMGSQTVKPGMEYMLRYNLQALTPEAKRQARANISAAYAEDVVPISLSISGSYTDGTWSGATWDSLRNAVLIGRSVNVQIPTSIATRNILVNITSAAIPTTLPSRWPGHLSGVFNDPANLALIKTIIIYDDNSYEIK